MTELETFTREVGEYSPKDWGQPWIAYVNMKDDGNFEFGEYKGTRGGPGTLILEEVNPPCIVAMGQKAYNKNYKSRVIYGLVNEDMKYEKCEDRKDAVNKLDILLGGSASGTEEIGPDEIPF